MNKVRGFTLIELMIVVAIIAILAAIAISQYQDYVAKAQVSEAFTIADGLKTSIVELYTQTAVCPDNNHPAVPAETSLAGRYVAQTVAGGVGTPDGGCTLQMTFKPAGSVSSAIANRQLTFELIGVESGPARWLCSNSNIDAKYLPRTCVP